MEDADAKKPDDEQLEKLMAMKAVAVRQAMFEIVSENRAEIVKRARAKLVSMGVPFAETEDL